MSEQMMVGGDLDERAPETGARKRSQDEQQCGVGQESMVIDRSEVTMGQVGRGNVRNSQVCRPDPLRREVLDNRSPSETVQKPEDDVDGADDDRPCPTFEERDDSVEI
jgi:hypothetical protein